MASNTVEFVLQLKDLMSGGMLRAASTAQRALGSIHNPASTAQRAVGGIGSAAQTAANRTQILQHALQMLGNRHRIAVDDSALASTQRRAHQLRNELDHIRRSGASQMPGSSMAAAGGRGGLDAGAGVMGFLKGGAIAAVAIKGASMAINAGRGAYDAALGNRGVENAVNVTTRGQGFQTVQQTKSIADKYGINYDASLEGVKTLTGGLMSMNMPLKEQMKIFEGVSTGVAALNLNADAAKGAFLALGQMASKGTVSAEELRGQLGERVPGAFGIAAKAMNVTEAALNNMLQKGEIAASDFLPKFAAEMQKTFGAEALKNANGPQAIQNRFNNAMANLQKTFGEGLLPIITPALQALTEIATVALPVVSNLFQSIAGVLPEIKSAVIEVLEPITSIQVNTQAWVPYIQMAKTLFTGVWESVKKVYGLVFNIVGGLAEWLANSQIVKDVFQAIMSFATGVKDAIGVIVDGLGWLFDNVVMPILNGVERAYRFVTGARSPEEDKRSQENAYSLEIAQQAQLAQSRQNYADIMKGINKQLELKNSVNGVRVGVAGGRGSGGSSKDLSSNGITHSGPRVITININKEMIGKIELKTVHMREGVADIESAFEEMLLRTLYSLQTANG